LNRLEDLFLGSPARRVLTASAIFANLLWQVSSLAPGYGLILGAASGAILGVMAEYFAASLRRSRGLQPVTQAERQAQRDRIDAASKRRVRNLELLLMGVILATNAVVGVVLVVGLDASFAVFCVSQAFVAFVLSIVGLLLIPKHVYGSVFGPPRTEEQPALRSALTLRAIP
jgi:putative Mn2+ efflux pump MntP